jgi:N-methylhydantoinase A
MGFWTALPRVDVESVGAGGGSLAWIDERSMLRVGPRSAGSSPGPVCYGRGGTQVALTDALLVLGYIDPARFLGGTMVLDRKAALTACAKLGEALGLDAVDAAWGVREIAVAEMVKAVRARLSNHALAAAEHCLVSYGGCGALFAAEVAKLAGLPRVLVPELASVLSAYGAATMDIRRERLTTLLMKLPGDANVIDRTFAALRDAVWQDLAADGVAEADREVRFELDMRWFLQRWELTIAVPGEPVPGDGGAQAEALFRAEYLRRFGAASTTTSGVVELVGIRAVGIGKMEYLPGTGEPKALRSNSGTASVASGGGVDTPPSSLRDATSPSRGGIGERPVSIKRSTPPEPIAVHDAASLAPGDHFTGPALVDSSDTTVWVPRGMTARVDPNRTLVIEVST